MACSGRTQVAAGVLIAVAICCSTCAYAERSPRISATAAATDESVLFGMIEARVDVSDRWLLSVAGAYLDPGSARDEAQLRLSAIGSASLGPWSIENRHLLSFSSASVERYRTRVRVVRPGIFGHHELSARVFDEVFFDLDAGRLFRNNIAVGAGLQMTQTLSGELYHVWEINRSRRDDAYVLALLTFRFGAPNNVNR